MTKSAAVIDSVWFNGDVYTMNAAMPTAQAFAVSAGKYVALGTNDEILALCQPATGKVDLAGRFIMPGLIDTHLHGIWGGLRDLFEAYVGFTADIAKLLAAVRAHAAKAAPGQWINGGPWYMRDIEQLGQSPRLLLDQHSPLHPVALQDATYHSLWVNSVALQVCGITRDTPDPIGGRIGRDPSSGEPDGILYESAQGLVRAFSGASSAQLDQALVYMRGYFHSLGIVGFKEAMAYEDLLRAYASADRANALDLHAAMHLARKPLNAAEQVPYETLERWRSQYRSAHVHTGFIKLFLDGVAPSRTAAFFEPYVSCTGCDPSQAERLAHDPDRQLLIAPDELNRELIEMDRRGFVVKMHAVGDRAARAGLDAIAAARAANGDSGLRHEIGHSAFVTEADHPRFRVLNAVAEMSPRLWFPNPVTPGQYTVLGNARTNRCHQIRSLMDAGAELTYGSDWPAAAADPNPWMGLAGMVTRRHPGGLFEGAVGPEQAITLERALPLFTSNAARALGLEHVTGSLSVGKSADFVALEHSIFGATPREIAETKPLQTVFEGRIVFER